MIQVKTYAFNPFQENTYLIYDETQKCIILDPGCYFAEEQKELTDFIAENGLQPEYIVHSHGHVDHILGSDYLRNYYNIQSIMHKDDLEVLRKSKDFGEMIGIEIDQPTDPEIFIKEGEKISFGNTSFDVLHLPGHSPGSIGLYNEKEQVIFAGDVLFRRGIGRTDLMGGDHATLIRNIKDKLLSLNDDTVVYPGHGDTTTIKEEKAENPLLV
ncbi:MAG: MBL fold metallo-hydrolase [Bacteroidales bacterium]|nr:MBL fold metallo-hydrolase [Bacteroidales bacterium]MBS3774159.1 MBL fold metallo-hydrolase [Bacteroidales bacterium]